MFHYIKGILTYTDASYAVVEAGGVGYKMTISQTTHDRLPAINGTVKLYSYMSVREDGVELFGFSSTDELNAFKMLIGVSGVGPKVAISVLSFLTPEKFALTISSEDAKTLSKANSVGSKTAARIILELKDKMSAMGSISVPDSSSLSGSDSSNSSSGAFADAVEALSAIGYTRAEILSALRGVDTSKMSVEEIFKTATKRLIR